MTPDAEEDLVQLIYAAALDPRLWVGVMEKLADGVGGVRGCLTTINVADGSGVEAILCRSDPIWVDAYAKHFGQINVFAAMADADSFIRGWNYEITTDEDCVAREDYKTSEYYNDFMRPQDVDRAMFIPLGLADGAETCINIGRKPNTIFERSDFELAERLLPHMVRAHRISQKLGRSIGVMHNLAEALEHSPHALYLIEDEGKLAFANRAGQRLLSSHRGLSLINGRLTPNHQDSARRFEELIGLASRRDGPRIGGAMSVPRPGRHFPLAVRTSPVPQEEGAIFRALAPVLVCVTDLENEVRSPEDDLKAMFGLTGAEARLATAVFNGLGLPEAAERFGVSINTVRFQLARVFDKTGAGRQADLVKLMMRLSGPGTT